MGAAIDRRADAIHLCFFFSLSLSLTFAFFLFMQVSMQPEREKPELRWCRQHVFYGESCQSLSKDNPQETEDFVMCWDFLVFSLIILGR